MKKSRRSQKLVKLLCAGILSFFVVFLGIAGFCYVIDPFGVYLRFKIAGVNEAKPFAGNRRYQRIWKPYATYLHHPDGILLGASRVAGGIDPHHPGFAPLAKKVFNLATGGSQMYEKYRYFLHANAINPLSLVVIGLGPGQSSHKLNKNFDDAALLTQPGSLSYILFKLAKETLFSFDSIKSSWQTLISQDKALPLQEGFNNAQRMERNRRAVMKLGHHGLFRNWERHHMRKIAKRKTNLTKLKEIEQGKDDPLELLRKILQICIKNKTRVILFINPLHARGVEMFRVRGDWPHIENWKRSLVRMVAEETEHAPENLVSLWDFGIYNSVTTEQLPSPGDKTTRMKYYWEYSHYKIHTGNLILDRILGYKEPGREVPKDFGIRLTPDNIDSHIKSDREKQRAYIRNHPDDVREIQETWEKYHAEFVANQAQSK